MIDEHLPDRKRPWCRAVSHLLRVWLQELEMKPGKEETLSSGGVWSGSHPRSWEQGKLAGACWCNHSLSPFAARGDVTLSRRWWDGSADPGMNCAVPAMMGWTPDLVRFFSPRILPARAEQLVSRMDIFQWTNYEFHPSCLNWIQVQHARWHPPPLLHSRRVPFSLAAGKSNFPSLEM